MCFFRVPASKAAEERKKHLGIANDHVRTARMYRPGQYLVVPNNTLAGAVADP